MAEIVVGREQGQVVARAELRRQGVDVAKLNTCAAAGLAQFGSVDVIAGAGRAAASRKTVR